MQSPEHASPATPCTIKKPSHGSLTTTVCKVLLLNQQEISPAAPTVHDGGFLPHVAHVLADLGGIHHVGARPVAAGTELLNARILVCHLARPPARTDGPPHDCYHAASVAATRQSAHAPSGPGLAPAHQRANSLAISPADSQPNELAAAQALHPSWTWPGGPTPHAPGSHHGQETRPRPNVQRHQLALAPTRPFALHSLPASSRVRLRGAGECDEEGRA